MAPEQVQGIHLTVSTDIYQIGITLFEMLTGDLPFSGDMSYAHVHESPPKVNDLVPGIDDGFSDLIDRCLAKKPADRPASVQDVQQTLQMIYSRLTSDQEAIGFDAQSDVQYTSQSLHRVDPSLYGAEKRAVSGPNGVLLGAAVLAAVMVFGGLAYVVFGDDATRVVADVEAVPVVAPPEAPVVEPPVVDPVESFRMASGVIDLGQIAAKNQADESAQLIEESVNQALQAVAATQQDVTAPPKTPVRRVLKKRKTKRAVASPKKTARTSKSSSKKLSKKPPTKSSDLLSIDGPSKAPKKKKKSGGGLLPMNE